jgi:hypothetical protein
MTAWGPQEWAAVGALGVGLVGAVGAGVVHAIRVSYRFGRSDEEQSNLRARLEKLELQADLAEAHRAGIEVLKAALQSVREQLAEVRQDLKHLMGVRPTSPRR